MGLFDSFLNGDTGSGLFGGLPASWQYQASPDDVKDPRAKAYLEAQAGSAPQLSDAFATPLPFWLKYFGLDTKPQNMPAVPGLINGMPVTGPSGNLPSAPIAPPSMPGVGQSGVFPPISFNTPSAPQAPQPPPRAPGGPDNLMPIAAPSADNPDGVVMPQFGKQFAGAQPRVREAASIPQNAQYTQGQIPGTPPSFMGAPTGGGIGDHLQAGAQSFANAGSPIGAIVGGLTGLLTGQRQDPVGIQQQNLKAQYDALVPMLGQNKAMLAVMNPKAAEILLQDALGDKTPPKTIEEVIARKMNNETDPAKLEKMLEFNRQRVAADKGAERAATTTAEAQATQQVALPDTLAKTGQAIKQIDELTNHPGKDWNLGIWSKVPPVPGTKGADFVSRVDQLKGNAFLEAYKAMRGTGPVSEKEGQMATQAQARLNRATSREDFDQALKDMREVLTMAYERNQRTAGIANPQPYQMQVGHSQDFGGGVSIKRIK